jgi:dUTP pyrophosphatase
MLINLSDEIFVIKDEERTCQMIISGHEIAEWLNVESIIMTGRGEGGFSHTGKH